MSTGADCHFREVSPGKWKYAIQRWPYGEWDEYDKHGPFDSFTEAMNHLDDNYPNPGGWDTHTHSAHVHNFVYNEYERITECDACGQTPSNEDIKE